MIVLCDICHKNVARVHLTKIHEGKKVEIHLCPECTKAQGIDSDLSGFSLASLLGSLSESAQSVANEGESSTASQMRCELCGQSYGDFRSTGKLGCERCYSVFMENLLPLLKRIQKGTEHAGKSPARIAKPEVYPLVQRIRKLREQLAEAVKREDYLEAARLRDQIKELEAQMNPSNKTDPGSAPLGNQSSS